MYLLLVDNARWSDTFNVCSEGEKRLDFFFCNVIRHDDRYDIMSTLGIPRM